jgi:hypothetical protein
MGVLDVPYNRNVNVNNLENPFGTYEGQQVVSTSENFWARLARLGRHKVIYNNALSFSAGSYGTIGTSVRVRPASTGHIFYPQLISVSATVDTQIWIQMYAPDYATSIATNLGNMAQIALVKANTPFQWYPDGTVYQVAGDNNAGLGGTSFQDGSIQIAVGGPTAGTLVYSISGIEIARNDI